jgi:predicted regulator of Ras-like GTPase activity (Roadblock/LC7/MglB family)
MDIFRNTLDGIQQRVEGVIAASIIGTDGIALHSVGQYPQTSLDGIAAEFTAFAKSIRVSNTELGSGNLEQFSVVTDRTITLLSSLTSDYFLLLVLGRDGNFGRARFETRKAKAVLESELS